ncbi:DUF3150 domain-containing protein [Motilimonas pumila]|uniref:DUF3150 domain-containing protein n=1 Tax=Motilimonas pumila TaxID=2303987 RepID=A0A418YA20_9GAMM|nr:DUF3150 domain-containing protein [Motilimonas pumila]RJG38785.1 DUF3150 domain-containing protein [Motilimonas pumila]
MSNEIKIAGMTPVFFNMHLWSGGGSLKPSDIGLHEDEVPKDLVNLGRIVAVKPCDLRWFLSKRKNLAYFLDNVGVRHAGGWLIPDSALEETKAKFEQATRDFLVEKQTFISRVERLIDESIEEAMAAGSPRLAEAIQNIAKRPDELEAIMQFSWSHLQDETGQIARSLLDNIAWLASKAKATVFNQQRKNPNKVTRGTFKGLVAIQKKMEGLSYLHSSLTPAAQRIADVLRKVDMRDGEKSTELSEQQWFELELLLSFLSDPEQLSNYASRCQSEASGAALNQPADSMAESQPAETLPDAHSDNVVLVSTEAASAAPTTSPHFSAAF